MRPAVAQLPIGKDAQDIPFDVPHDITQQVVRIVVRRRHEHLYNNLERWVVKPGRAWCAQLCDEALRLAAQNPGVPFGVLRVRRLAAKPFSMTHAEIAAHVGCELADVEQALGTPIQLEATSIVGSTVVTAALRRPKAKRRKRKRVRAKARTEAGHATQ